MERDAGAGGVAIVRAEGVVEDALDGAGGGVVGVEGEAAGEMEAERAQVVHAEDVVGVAVGVEDGVDAAEVLADGLGVEVGAGVDEDVVAVVGERGPRDGCGGCADRRWARRRDVQTAQSHPSVGTPMEVPVPRNVRVACMSLSGRCWARPRLAGARTSAGPPGWRLSVGGGASEGLGDFEEAHADFEERAVDELGLLRSEVALGFFGEDGEHVDALARAHQVDLGLLALLRGSAELHDGGHVDRTARSGRSVIAGGWSMPGLAARTAVSRRSAVCW